VWYALRHQEHHRAKPGDAPAFCGGLSLLHRSPAAADPLEIAAWRPKIKRKEICLLTRNEIIACMTTWFEIWNHHDLERVMDLFHDDILFENWTGARVRGKENLHRAWKPWFGAHGDFRFTTEDFFVDEASQKALYQWRLDWPSREKGFQGKAEVRRGVDVYHFQGGKIIQKLTYSKTTLDIEGLRVALHPTR
jgi:ketosteroid isomerase-like protein